MGYENLFKVFFHLSEDQIGYLKSFFYKQLLEELIEQGFVMQGVTKDVKRGVTKAFGEKGSHPLIFFS